MGSVLLVVLALMLQAPAGAVGLPDGLFAAEAETADDAGSSFPPMRRLLAQSALISTGAVSDARAEPRAAAVLALGRRKERAAVEAVLKADAHWWPRFAAAYVLPKAAGCEAAEPLERAATADPQWQVRVRAVQSLAELGEPGSVPALAAALRDSDDGVRAAAAYGLAELGGAEALAVLGRAAKTERDPLLRQLLSSAFRRALSDDLPAPPACAQRRVASM